MRREPRTAARNSSPRKSWKMPRGPTLTKTHVWETARGDELPAELSGSGRRARIWALLDELEADATKQSLETRLARRAEIEAATGRRLPGRKPKPDAQHRR